MCTGPANTGYSRARAAIPENIPKIIRSEARGTLVGVVYGPGGIGIFTVAVALDIPDYVGPAFYAEEPTWVPILPMTAVKGGTRMRARSFPWSPATRSQ